ncbi:hypothetical protein E2P81_ATG00568 [Venturia nashicola]|uniref:Uncharacterized protein n=1 Tax=Venturia nashicola TaxID=86259 RepID=A0A4Z1PFT9_9PEZI|nr:hypothetical protein E6O75_ATG00580 [Venturia nashicola]TLD39581.1 hypothetical protein E2P81_ATG00568 [Venturia nashicola]
MVAFETSSLIARGAHQLLKRKKNFAQKNPGIILVFCIVGSIFFLIVGILLMKKIAARKHANEHKAASKV